MASKYGRQFAVYCTLVETVLLDLQSSCYNLCLSFLAASLDLRLALANRALDTLLTGPLFLKKLYRALGGILTLAVPQVITLAQTSL